MQAESVRTNGGLSVIFMEFYLKLATDLCVTQTFIISAAQKETPVRENSQAGVLLFLLVLLGHARNASHPLVSLYLFNRLFNLCSCYFFTTILHGFQCFMR